MSSVKETKDNLLRQLTSELQPYPWTWTRALLFWRLCLSWIGWSVPKYWKSVCDRWCLLMADWPWRWVSAEFHFLYSQTLFHCPEAEHPVCESLTGEWHEELHQSTRAHGLHVILPYLPSYVGLLGMSWIFISLAIDIMSSKRIIMSVFC